MHNFFYYINLLEFKDQSALFNVGCQAGTYIRKLCFDMGEITLTGATMAELRRTRSGIFKEDDTMVTLQDLNDAMYLYEEENDDENEESVEKEVSDSGEEEKEED